MEYECGSTSKCIDDTESGTAEMCDIVSQLYESKDYADFTISCNGAEMPVHKFVLAGKSSYFRGMFQNGMQEALSSRATLDDLPTSSLSVVLEYMYKHAIEITNDNVCDILEVSHHLNIDNLTVECEKFLLQKIWVDNVIDRHRLADRYELADLKEESNAIMLKSFTPVSKTPAFLKVEIDFLSRLLSDDRLTVSNESDVFDAVNRWIEHDEEARAPHVENVLKLVRYAHCSPGFIINVVLRNKYVLSFNMKDHLLTAALHKLDQTEAEPLNYQWRQERLGYYSDETLFLLVEDGSLLVAQCQDLTTIQPWSKVPGTLKRYVRAVVGPNHIFAVSFVPPLTSSPMVVGLDLHSNRQNPEWRKLPIVQSLPIKSMAVHDRKLVMWCVDRDSADWVSFDLDSKVQSDATESDVVGCINECLVVHDDYVMRLYCSSERAEAFMVKLKVEDMAEEKGQAWDPDLAERLSRCEQITMLVYDNKVHISTEEDYIIYNPGTEQVESCQKVQRYSLLLIIEGKLVKMTEDTTADAYRYSKWMPSLKCFMPCGMMDTNVNDVKILQMAKLNHFPRKPARQEQASSGGTSTANTRPVPVAASQSQIVCNNAPAVSVANAPIAGPSHPSIAAPNQPPASGPIHASIAVPNQPTAGGPIHASIAAPNKPTAGGPIHASIAAPNKPTASGPIHASISAPSQPPVAGPSQVLFAGPSQARVAGPSQARVAGPSQASVVALRQVPAPTVALNQVSNNTFITVGGHPININNLPPGLDINALRERWRRANMQHMQLSRSMPEKKTDE